MPKYHREVFTADTTKLISLIYKYAKLQGIKAEEFKQIIGRSYYLLAKLDDKSFTPLPT